jgi:hypothetical protein
MAHSTSREHAIEQYEFNLDHPEILKAILAGILETGDVIGQDDGRTMLAVAVDDWLMEELAAIGAAEREEELAA